MGQQVIKCPDGTLAIFSSVVDAWTVYNATPDEIVEHFAEQAAADARRDARRIVDAVMAGQPCKVYYQFTKTFEEADALSVEHDGISLAVKDERAPALDSESWTCQGPCHGQFIGHRPANDICKECA